MSQYFPPYRSSGRNIKVELDLSNYATKTDLKNVTHLDVSSFASKTNQASLKTEVDKLDIDKLTPVPNDLVKLSNVVKNDVVKKTEYDQLVSQLNSIDSTNFVSKTKYKKDGLNFEDNMSKADKKIPDVSDLVKKTNFNSKISEVESKIPSITGLATNSALTAVENKILDVRSLVKKTDFDTQLKKVSGRVTSNKSRHLLIETELRKLQNFDSSYFRGKDFLEKNYLVFKPRNRYFKKIDNTRSASSWESNRLSDEVFKPPINNNSLAPKLEYVSERIFVKLDGSCLIKQYEFTFDKKTVIIYIVYDLDSILNNFDPTLENFLFGAIKISKNVT